MSSEGTLRERAQKTNKKKKNVKRRHFFRSTQLQQGATPARFFEVICSVDRWCVQRFLMKNSPWGNTFEADYLWNNNFKESHDTFFEVLHSSREPHQSVFSKHSVRWTNSVLKDFLWKGPPKATPWKQITYEKANGERDILFFFVKTDVGAFWGHWPFVDSAVFDALPVRW